MIRMCLFILGDGEADYAIYVLNLRQIYNPKVIKQEKNTTLYEWAKLFKAESWEEIRMLAEKYEEFDECATALAQLTEDEKIRMQCEARDDYIARQKGLERRITERVTKEVTERITEEVTERVTEEVTERVTEEVTERVTEEVTERVTEQVAENLAIKLLDVLDVSIISEKTGLSIEQLEQLKKRHCPK